MFGAGKQQPSHAQPLLQPKPCPFPLGSLDRDLWYLPFTPPPPNHPSICAAGELGCVYDGGARGGSPKSSSSLDGGRATSSRDGTVTDSVSSRLTRCQKSTPPSAHAEPQPQQAQWESSQASLLHDIISRGGGGKGGGACTGRSGDGGDGAGFSGDGNGDESVSISNYLEDPKGHVQMQGISTGAHIMHAPQILSAPTPTLLQIAQLAASALQVGLVPHTHTHIDIDIYI